MYALVAGDPSIWTAHADWGAWANEVGRQVRSVGVPTRQHVLHIRRLVLLCLQWAVVYLWGVGFQFRGESSQERAEIGCRGGILNRFHKGLYGTTTASIWRQEEGGGLRDWWNIYKINMYMKAWSRSDHARHIMHVLQEIGARQVVSWWWSFMSSIVQSIFEIFSM